MENEELTGSNMLESYNIKERSINFSKQEVENLKKLVCKYTNILMCKKTDGISCKQKDKAWRCIEKEFNAVGQIPRTMKQLKYKFENIKRNAKKEASRERQEMRRTGGGKPPSLPPGSEDSTEWLRSIMSSSIDGNDAIYDDDVIILNTISITDIEKSKSVIIDQTKSNDKENVNLTKIPITFDCSTPHSSLKRPMAPQLKSKKKANTDNLIKRALREKKLSVLDDLHNFELEKIKQSINQQKELHEQTIRHNNEKQKLYLLKVQLEIDILQQKKENEVKKT